MSWLQLTALNQPNESTPKSCEVRPDNSHVRSEWEGEIDTMMDTKPIWPPRASLIYPRSSVMDRSSRLRAVVKTPPASKTSRHDRAKLDRRLE
mmetsp:Transcript_48338/g.102801  ORF Transcript_48338/g.102801 Transcript_48338/m.102801 type:complete len:93 (-) Transcript_48338:91-369(-)